VAQAGTGKIIVSLNCYKAPEHEGCSPVNPVPVWFMGCCQACR